MDNTNKRTADSVSRRTILKLGIATAALAACNRVPGAAAITTSATPSQTLVSSDKSPAMSVTTTSADVALKQPAQAWLAANRLMYGPRPGDLAHIDDIGIDAFIEEQLQLSSNQPDGDTLHAKLQPLNTLTMAPAELMQAAEDKRGIILLELNQATILRSVYSERQLHEVMVDFWTNHFNIYFSKDQDRFLKTIDDRDVIRPHTMGKFRDLLDASAHSPAMLVYLDNVTNRKGNPNENYARELMELHTIGVAGGYTQDDVKAVARAFTGWTAKPYKKTNPSPDSGQYIFNPRQHDDDAKTILGQTLPARGGERDGTLVLDMLARNPACATYISTKLVRRFVSDQPPATAIQSGAAAFTKSDGDITATLSAILHSDEFKTSFGQKLKRPYDLLASSLRALAADTDGGPPLQAAMIQMGQPLFQWQFPNGYPDSAGAWSGASTLLARWNFGIALGANGLKGTHVDFDALNAGKGAGLIESLSKRFFGSSLPATVRDAVMPFATDASQLTAVLFASPLFQTRG